MEDLYQDPLLQWLRTFPDGRQDLGIDDLVGGPFLHSVIHSFDDSIPNHYSVPAPSDFKAKVKNLEAVIKNLKCYYQSVLGQTLLESLPSALILCDRGMPQPPRGVSLPPQDIRLQFQNQMHQLLSLVLGAAVQCSQKEHIVSSMKTLPVEVQKVLVERIPEVTENPEWVWSADYDDPTSLQEDVRNQMYHLLVRKLKQLVEQRDSVQGQLMQAELEVREKKAAIARQGPAGGALSPEKSHLAVEISEFKAKIRKLNQQLEEKTECLNETAEELEKASGMNTKLRQEALDLAQDARAAKTYRDELDVVRERANKVEKLEAEIHRYKDKINDIEFYKSRVDELREDNKILVETKEILEDQLENSRKRSEHLITLENEILRFKSDLSAVEIERESLKERLSEVEEENLALQMNSKSASLSQSRSFLAEVEQSVSEGKNIYNEKLEKDTTRVHKLELENQRLRSELDSAREKGFHESSERILDLEKEKQKLSVHVKQLELLRSKDESFSRQLERDLSEERGRAVKSEQMKEALKEAYERLNLEKEAEVVQLTQQMDSIRKRQTQTQNEQISSLEEDNKMLTKANAKLETDLMKANHSNKRLSDRAEELNKIVEQFEDLKLEKEKSNSLLEDLQKQNEELKILKEEDEGRKEALSNLKMENSRVNKQLERLKAELSALTMERQQLNTKLQHVTRRSEKLQNDNLSLTSLETERDELRDTISRMRLEIDQLTTLSKAGEEQDQKHATILSDNHKLSRQFATCQRKLEEQREENVQLENQLSNMQKTIDTLKSTTRRVEQLEKENFDLEDSQHKLDREVKSLRKEMERHKHSSEVKEAELEEAHSFLKVVEKEKTRLEKQTHGFAEEASKMAELEADHRKLLQDYTMEKRALVKLREELVSEKLLRGQAETELQNATDNMHRLGMTESAMQESIADERMKTLEGSISDLLEKKQKRVTSLESTLKELTDKYTALQQKNSMLQIHVDAGDSKTKLEAQLCSVMKERDQFQAEAVNLKLDAKSAKEKVCLFEEKMKKLHEEAANIQVENSTLQSQSSSLLSQINQLQISQVNLETFKRKAEEAEKQWQSERADLLRDQAGLQKLHDNLQADYESLRAEKEVLKDTEKKLRIDLRKFHAESLSLSEGQDDLLRAKEAIDLERENLRADARTLANLRDEHARLKDDFRSLFTSNERVKGEYCGLQTDYKGLKSSFNQTKLMVTELKGQLHESREQHQMVDVELTKTMNRCEVLARMNASLEDDRKSLMSQVSILLTQYHDLLTQTLDDKEHFHEEERVYTDKMNNLHRQKEKLEEKIMEQYRKMENSPPKKMGFGGKIVRTMRKASSSLTGNRSGATGGLTSAAAAVPPRSRSSTSFQSSASEVVLSTTEHRRVVEGAGRTVHEGEDTSSLESGCNDSLDSGQASPMRAHLEDGGGSTAAGSSSGLRRRSFTQQLPLLAQQQLHSDENSADNDSVVSGSRIPRVYGHPDDRISLNHSEVGIPVSASSSELSRRISKVYVNGVDKEGQVSTVSWNQENSRPPPVIPSRNTPSGAPERPPKPSGPRSNDDNRYRSDEERIDDDADQGSNKGSLGDEEERTRENTEWYEYGCV